MSLSLPQTIYLVQTMGWEFIHWEAQRRYRIPAAATSDVVDYFVERDLAEERCLQLENEKRAEANPFEYCEQLEELTCFDADRWHDWVLDAGLEPPNDGWQRADWLQWWVENCPKMTELQQARMWEAMPKLRFYSIVELRAASAW